MLLLVHNSITAPETQTVNCFLYQSKKISLTVREAELSTSVTGFCILQLSRDWEGAGREGLTTIISEL